MRRPEDEVVARIEEVSFKTEISVRGHAMLADEPEEEGGKDLGPTPVELVSSALASCTAITLRMYALRKEWPLHAVEVRVAHDLKKPVSLDEGERPRRDIFYRTIEVEGPLTHEQRERCLEIANKCPTYRLLASPVTEIVSSISSR